jgi:hypothetical protein
MIHMARAHIELYAAINQKRPMDTDRGDDHEQERVLQYLARHHGQAISEVYKDEEAVKALQKLARGFSP